MPEAWLNGSWEAHRTLCTGFAAPLKRAVLGGHKTSPDEASETGIFNLLFVANKSLVDIFMLLFSSANEVFGILAPMFLATIGVFGILAPMFLATDGVFGILAPMFSATNGVFGILTPMFSATDGVFGILAPMFLATNGVFGILAPMFLATDGVFGILAPMFLATNGVFGILAPVFLATDGVFGILAPMFLATDGVFGILAPMFLANKSLSGVLTPVSAPALPDPEPLAAKSSKSRKIESTTAGSPRAHALDEGFAASQCFVFVSFAPLCGHPIPVFRIKPPHPAPRLENAAATFQAPSPARQTPPPSPVMPLNPSLLDIPQQIPENPLFSHAAASSSI